MHIRECVVKRNRDLLMVMNFFVVVVVFVVATQGVGSGYCVGVGLGIILSVVLMYATQPRNFFFFFSRA